MGLLTVIDYEKLSDLFITIALLVDKISDHPSFQTLVYKEKAGELSRFLFVQTLAHGRKLFT